VGKYPPDGGGAPARNRLWICASLEARRGVRRLGLMLALSVLCWWG